MASEVAPITFGEVAEVVVVVKEAEEGLAGNLVAAGGAGWDGLQGVAGGGRAGGGLVGGVRSPEEAEEQLETAEDDFLTATPPPPPPAPLTPPPLDRMLTLFRCCVNKLPMDSA